MKIFYFGALVLFLTYQSTDGAVVRKQPAFAKPIYSNSYLPAAMQVIFHAVDQLKHLEADEAEEMITSTTTSVPTTSAHAPGQHQPIPNEAAMEMTDSTGSIPDDPSTISSEASSTASITIADSTASTASTPLLVAVVHEAESPESIRQNTEENKPEVAQAVTVPVDSETPEENYATPETNHEIQETVQETAEANQEISERIYNGEEETSGITGATEAAEVAAVSEPKPSNSSEEEDKENSSDEESKEEKDESKGSGSSESKEESGESSESKQSAEEEDDEIRFAMIGEKVSQVPRPSLTSYLRKTVKSPLRSSVQELASLYDALSKDARKQGLAKYSGYSDEVLKTLESTMEGGVGPQLRTLLEKAVERNELTRDDTKVKLSNTLNHLSDPATTLSRDLRRLVPLRYIP